MKSLGLILITIGFCVALAGVFFYFFRDIPFLGKLPGDMQYKGGKVDIYFPLGSCILLSVILTLLLNVLLRLFGK